MNKPTVEMEIERLDSPSRTIQPGPSALDATPMAPLRTLRPASNRTSTSTDGRVRTFVRDDPNADRQRIVVNREGCAMAAEAGLAPGLRKDLVDLEAAAAWSAEYQMTATGFWTNLQISLGAAAAVIAGVSSVSALRNSTLLAGISAAVAAALSAVLASIRPSERAQNHDKAGREYNAVRVALQQLLAEPPSAPTELAKGIEVIRKQWLSVSTTSPWVPRRLYRKTRRLVADGTPYFVDAPLPVPAVPASLGTRLLNRFSPGWTTRAVPTTNEVPPRAR